MSTHRFLLYRTLCGASAEPNPKQARWPLNLGTTTPPAQLPPELLLDIIDIVVSSDPSHARRGPNLAALAATSRKFHSLANPLLYRDLLLDSPNRLKILSTLASSEILLGEVRTLTISGGELSVGEFEYMKDTLSRCPNVSRLSYVCFDSWYLPSFTIFVAKTWSSSLQYLRTDHKEGLFDLLCQLPHLETLVAARVDFPSTTNTPPDTSARLQELPSTTRGGIGLLPTFRLKRLDSGSSPHSSHFDLLTSSSRATLLNLDLPISSRSPRPNLASFPSLSRLTLTLAERYIPHDLDSRLGVPGGPLRQERDDVECLRRVLGVLSRMSETGESRAAVKVELFQPDYPRTREFSSEDLEEAELLEGLPKFVEEFDLSTLRVGARYLLRMFGSEAKEAARGTIICEGLKRLT
ncbi:hypothetical protein JCM16303_004156 [Sporobolomyces ruberrimus]